MINKVPTLCFVNLHTCSNIIKKYIMKSICYSNKTIKENTIISLLNALIHVHGFL